MARLSIALLGVFQVELDGEPVASFGYDKVRALLAYLAIEADRAHRREALVELLWPEQDERAGRHSLSQALFSLRQALRDQQADPPYLLLTRQTVQLNPAAEIDLDVATFTALLDACDRHVHRRPERCRSCARRLEQAVTLYRGGLLEGLAASDSVAFEEWALVRREHLHGRACRALNWLSASHEERGNLELAAEHTRGLIALDPWREDAHRRLMRLLERNGQRAGALEQFERCRQLLADDLGLDPEDETTALYDQIRTGQDDRSRPTASYSAPVQRVNLPAQSTPFVGREWELAALAALIEDDACRLVTLTGPGGIGKTRLALQFAASQGGAFADGVHFVPLAALASAALLPSAIGDGLRLHFQAELDPAEQLLDWLRERELLLVLDNFEHLIDGAVFVGRLLERAPDLRIVATSRERLDVQGEWIFEVTGLSLSDEGRAGGGASSAERLFMQRARKADWSFSPTGDDVRAINRICQLVDGVPLGIELAAAWVPVLSCQEIASEIERSLDFLASSARDLPERHRSMRAVFDRSWEMLGEAEQRAFQRLAVFRGGFHRDAAEQVSGASLAMLSGLVAKSFLRRGAAGRYEMHELLRHYAEEHLEASPEDAWDARDQHCDHYTALLARSETALKSRDQEIALAEIRAEIENIRAAWQWATRQRRANAVARAVQAYWIFSEVTGRYLEGLATFKATADALQRNGNPRPGRLLALGRLLTAYGSLYIRSGDPEQGSVTIERSIEVLRPLGVPSDLGLALNFRAMYAHARQDFALEERTLRESIACFVEAGDEWGMGYSLNDLGQTMFQLGEVDESRKLHEQSLTLFRQLGDKRGSAFALRNLGGVAFHLGQYATARQCLQESLAIRQAIRHGWGVADALIALSIVARETGAVDDARDYCLSALQVATDVQSRPAVAEALTELAVLLAREGRRERAIDILTTVSGQPAISAIQRERTRQLLREIGGATLPEADARAATRDALDELARMLLADDALLIQP